MLYTEQLHWFLTLFFFIFGSLLGSFSNVVVLRMAIKRSVIFPPSACPKCNHQLHAIDLVPIFSWLFLRGKCRYCSVPISVQYPLVESFMAIIIALSFYKTGLSNSGLPFICLSSSMAIWFVVSTIFVREEVLKHQPFIWAVVYSLLLRYLIVGKNLFFLDNNFVYAIIAFLFVGIRVGIKKKSLIEFTRWGCLAFLTFFYSGFRIWFIVFYLVILGLFEENSEKSLFQAKWVFYIMQLICILQRIL